MIGTETDVVTANRTEKVKKRRIKLAFINFFMVWVLIIVGGFYAAHSYMEKWKTDITAQIEEQTVTKMDELQSTYDQQLKELEESYSTQLEQLQSKINGLNELLTFTKDNADSNTDNSNMLYTQLNQMKSQLKELQKSLELLKS